MKNNPRVRSFIVWAIVCLALPGMAWAATANRMPTKMVGYGWAPNLGWFNFGSATDPHPNANKPGVTVDARGIFSGYAWNSNTGWYRFFPLKIGTKNPVAAVASLSKPGTYNLDGWFRACGAYQAGCSVMEKNSAGTEMGGWDGWLKMKGVSYDPASGSYSGFAWGALVDGWVNLAAAHPTGDNSCPLTIAGKCNPNCAVCGGSGTDDDKTPELTASCYADKPAPGIGDEVTWNAKIKGGSGKYDVVWNKWSDGEPEPVPADSDKEVYTAADTYYRSMTAVDQNDPELSSGEVTCAASVKNAGTGGGCTNNCGVAVAGGTCALTVYCHKSADNGEAVDGFVCGQKTTLPATQCGTDLTLQTSNNSAIWWKAPGQCPADYTTQKSDTATLAIPLSGAVTACADWGPIDSEVRVQIIDGDGAAGNIVNITNPSLYPVYSSSDRGAKLSIAGGSAPVAVSDWGGLLEAARSSAACPASAYPQLVIGTGASALSVTAGGASQSFGLLNSASYPIRFRFPNKCIGSNGYSVFHNPAGYWKVGLSTGAKTIYLNLKFIDQNPSSR
jgi:hypothetical protein